MSSSPTIQAQVVVLPSLTFTHGEFGASHLHGLRLGHINGAWWCLVAGADPFPGVVRIPPAMGDASIG